MTVQEHIAELERQLAILKAETQKPALAIRSVKVGDLEWQADVPDKTFTWQQGKDYAASLGDGWRLPTVKELLTLVDYEKRAPACGVFPDCPDEWFWSSSALSGDPSLAWGVAFNTGSTSISGVSYTARVRCVR